MRPVHRMFFATSSLSLLFATACSDPIDPTGPTDASTPSLAVVASSPGTPVEVNVGDTVQLKTQVKDARFTPRNTSIVKVLTSGRVQAVAPGRTYVVAWTSPYRYADFRDSTLVIVRSPGTAPSEPTESTEPAAGDATPVAGAYYVSLAGSDANAGTQSQPWRSIAKALPRLRPGQTLYLRGGTYRENIQNPSIQPGRADARITVAAYPGERPVIVGLLHLTRPSYWTLDGVNVTWATGNSSKTHMVKLTNGVGWVIQNSELWGARSFANLLISGTTSGEPANWAVRNNCIHDTYASNSGNQDQNMYVNTGTSAGRGLIERNVIFNAPNGQNVKLGYGRSDPQPGDGTANVTVRYNTMYNSLKPLSIADASHHNTIERNIIGKSAEGYALRAYRLYGTSNVMRDNVFFGLSKLQYADRGSVTDGGGNRLPLDPRFNALGCGDFKPTAAEARGYGHTAP